MWVLIAAVIVLGIVVYLLSKVKQNKTDKEEKPTEEETCARQEYCCGAHEVCESGKIKQPAPQYDYYEDEELDRFKGRASDDYTDEEILEFNEVLQTLRPEEINDWLESLKKRGINLPYPLKNQSPPSTLNF